MTKLLLTFLLTFAFLLVLSTGVSAQALSFSMLGQDPDPVRAGDVVEVRFKVENTWEQTRYGVNVEIVPEYPFSLYGNAAVKELGRIDGREYGSNAVYFDFKLRVDVGASDGDHEIRLRVLDGDKGAWELKNMFYIDVDHERIEVKPYIVSSTLVTGGGSGSFTIEMANSGGVDVDALELELMPSTDYKLLSTSNYVYLGNLESDDTESEDFTIYVEKGVTDVHIPVTLTYEYKDEQYSREEDLVLRLLTQKEAKQVGLVKQSMIPYIIGAGAVVIVALFLIRRFRKR